MLTVNFQNEELIVNLNYIGSSIVLLSVSNRQKQEYHTEPFYFDTVTEAYGFIFRFGNELVTDFGLEVIV